MWSEVRDDYKAKVAFRGKVKNSPFLPLRCKCTVCFGVYLSFSNTNTSALFLFLLCLNIFSEVPFDSKCIVFVVLGSFGTQTLSHPCLWFHYPTYVMNKMLFGSHNAWFMSATYYIRGNIDIKKSHKVTYIDSLLLTITDLYPWPL